MNETQWPKIQKANRVIGKTLTLRNADVKDAKFILSLRTNDDKSRYLSATSSDINVQIAWLESYAVSCDQAYFIIESKGEAIGTVRLYDARQSSFCWGSWILKDGSPSHAAVESALIVYAYAIDHLGFRSAHFDVRKNNDRVCKFHERFRAHITATTELDYFYSLDLQSIKEARIRYARFLPDGVIVQKNDC